MGLSEKSAQDLLHLKQIQEGKGGDDIDGPWDKSYDRLHDAGLIVTSGVTEKGTSVLHALNAVGYLRSKRG